VPRGGNLPGLSRRRRKGTVADDDTIFVATRTEEDQDQLFERFKKYLSV
jgi:arginine repressor